MRCCQKCNKLETMCQRTTSFSCLTCVLNYFKQPIVHRTCQHCRAMFDQLTDKQSYTGLYSSNNCTYKDDINYTPTRMNTLDPRTATTTITINSWYVRDIYLLALGIIDLQINLKTSLPRPDQTIVIWPPLQTLQFPLWWLEIEFCVLQANIHHAGVSVVR